MKKLLWTLLFCFVCIASAAEANGSSKTDVETFAKEHSASFHWFPVQKNFILATAQDTAKFAIGLPFVDFNGKSIQLSMAPEFVDGHILVSNEDVKNLFATKAIAQPASSSTTKTQAKAVPASSSSVAKVAATSAATKAAPASSASVKNVAASSSSAKVVAAPASSSAKKVAAASSSAQTKSSSSPAVAAPKNETAGTREVKTIVLDPGHGGKDSGALGLKSQEKDLVLAVAKELKKELEKDGFTVKMTRDKDEFIELGQRANLANSWDGDLFISLHCNAIDGTPEQKKQVKGYHIYVLRAPESEEDKAIARRENKVATLYGEKNAKEELSPIEWFKLEARLEKYKQNSYMFTEEMLKAMDGGKIRRQAGGVGGAGFMVLVGALMPAVLYEIGFISNPDDEVYMMSAAGQQSIAQRISKAVASYKAAVHNYRETLGR